MKPEDMTLDLLRQTLQDGKLNYSVTMEKLMDITSCETGYFFEALPFSSLFFICRFTSQKGRYVEGVKYSFEDLPEGAQYNVYHKSNIIAILCFDKPNACQLLNQHRIHDGLSFGIVMGALTTSKHSLILSVCQSLQKYVVEIARSSERVSDNNLKGALTENVDHMYKILYDTLNFIDLDMTQTPQVELTSDVVTVADFFQQTIDIVRERLSGTVVLNIEDDVPSHVVFDLERVQQVVTSVLFRLGPIVNITVGVALKDYSAREEQVLFLEVKFSSDSRRKIEDILALFEVETVNTGTLDVFVVRKLCEVMGGDMQSTESGLLLTFRIELPTNGFSDKRIVAAVHDKVTLRSVTDNFEKLGATVSRYNPRTTSIVKYDVMVLDTENEELVDQAIEKGVPVIIVRSETEHAPDNDARFSAVLQMPLTMKNIEEKLRHIV